MYTERLARYRNVCTKIVFVTVERMARFFYEQQILARKHSSVKTNVFHKGTVQSQNKVTNTAAYCTRKA